MAPEAGQQLGWIRTVVDQLDATIFGNPVGEGIVGQDQVRIDGLDDESSFSSPETGIGTRGGRSDLGGC